jgi:Ca2+-binding EF-hand superfamily protein
MYAQQSNTNGLSNDEIRQAFREFDLDRNGYVGAAEIAHVLGSMNPPVKATDDEIDEMVRLCASFVRHSRVSRSRFAYSPLFARF